MGMWFREVAGWIVLGLGVAAYVLVFVFLTNRWFLEGGILAFSGYTLLRTGTHLLKVATAARAAAGLDKRETGPRRRVPSTDSLSGRPRSAVVPGPASVRSR